MIRAKRSGLSEIDTSFKDTALATEVM
jgi:hypothetical protein